MAGTVEVHDLGEGVQAIRMSTLSADGARNVLTPALCAALAEAFTAVSSRAGLRAVVLEGTDEIFAQGDVEACAAMLSSGLVAAIAACPVPVLAACAGDAVDAGWWLASLGDQLIASEDGRYGYGPGTLGLQAVSYTHLDVYKRQDYYKQDLTVHQLTSRNRRGRELDLHVELYFAKLRNVSRVVVQLGKRAVL